MKNYLFILIATLSFNTAFSQLNSGSIIYNEKINVHAMLPPQAQAYKDMIPEFREQKKELLFNESISKYANKEAAPGEEEVKTNTQGNVQMRFKRMEDKSETIYDIEKKEKLEFKEFMDRPFIITEENAMGEIKWKIGAGQKEILGYICQEAIYFGEKDTVLAWFAPQIPVSTGPRGMGNLPGMILEMDINDGKTHIVATEIVAKEIDSKELAIKGKGKKVTSEEFKTIVEEKQKEMKEMYGGNGNVMIRTRH